MNRQRGFVLPTLWLALGAALAGAAGGTVVTRLYYLNEIHQAAEDRRDAEYAAMEAQRLAARGYEAGKVKRATASSTLNRKVESELQKHRAWADSPIPDGLRQSIESAAEELGATEPGGSVPAVQGDAAAAQP